MALDNQDREYIRLVATEAAAAVVKEVLKQHIASCPHGKRLMVILAVCMGAGVFGGSLAGGLVSRLLMGI